MKWHRVALGCLASALVAGSIAGIASGGGAAARQRIAIEGSLNPATARSTWQLIPLTEGEVARDSGTGIGDGKMAPSRVRANGQRVTVITGKDVLTGKRGSLTLTQRVESHDAGHGYTADIGTWRLASPTGDYAGLRGGGGFAAVYLQSGRVRFRMEGYVSR